VDDIEVMFAEKNSAIAAGRRDEQAEIVVRTVGWNVDDAAERMNVGLIGGNRRGPDQHDSSPEPAKRRRQMKRVLLHAAAGEAMSYVTIMQTRSRALVDRDLAPAWGALRRAHNGWCR